MSDSVSLDFIDDGDGTGRVVVRVQARGFGGEAEGYVNARDLPGFASELRAFPLPGHVTFDVGHGDARIRLDFYPFDEKGHIRVDVELASNGGAVTTNLVVTYGSLERFARALVGATNGNGESAMLVTTLRGRGASHGGNGRRARGLVFRGVFQQKISSRAGNRRG